MASRVACPFLACLRLSQLTSNLAACAAVLLALANPTRAEEPEEPVERIVVTATRNQRPVSTIGNSVSLLDAEDIELHQDTLLIDALERVPGITLRRQGGPGTSPSIFIRGANSNHTLLLVDGVKLHDAAGPNRETQLDHLAVEDIERIEVLRGPQSVLYGSDAIGGVINVITKGERGAPRVRASAEGGSFRTHNETASVRGGNSSGYYSASVTHTDTRGFSIATTDPSGERDGYQRTALAGKFGLGGEQVGVDAAFRYVDADVELDTGFDVLRAETKSEQLVGRIAPRASLFDGAWEQTLAYSVNHARRDTEAFGSTRFTGRIQEIDWQHTLRPAEAITVVVGAEWERESLRGTSAQNTFAPNAVRESVDAYSGYADLQLAPHDRVDLTGGARVYHHDVFGTEVVGRGSLVVRADEIGALLRASVGNGFKAPTLGQLYDDTFGTNNPNLEAERSLGFDVAAAWRSSGDRLGAEIGYFENDIEDLIVGAAPTFVADNIARANTHGIEASADARLLERASGFGQLDARVDVTYLRTRDELNGRRLLRRPNQELSATFRWSPIECLDLATSVRWVDDRLDFSPVTFLVVEANAYTVVDLLARFEVVDGVELFARIDNVANEDYEDVAGFRQSGIAGYGGIRIDLAELGFP